MVLEQFALTGKVALVTGCNTGLGQGMAVGLAQAGCDIIGVNIAEPLETRQQIEALGRRFVNIAADLSRYENLQNVTDEASAVFGRIDILVNNAGIIRRQDALEFSEQDWDDVMNVNVKTVFFLSQAVAKTVHQAGNRRQNH
ncbi:2-dehydro-3-deoxy-D-gluconate 5-dehydrogenase [Cedecea neteri]|uniref:2-dehydro-3-deoxy-D-gluconate 5-dehydrogenase n=1 Tax=Cedecea neteri TaxID=158822 RepID=A0A2X3L570_9ENTR|nr:2-dehydro-3-deoxy-D-gluconate 5-dehydrogenase [Cedecea neteri]